MTETLSGDVLGYVVVDWNQASGQPDVDTNGLYTTREDAESDAVYRQAETDRIGRGERHTVAAVIEIEED
jgi:hypothetical protein